MWKQKVNVEVNQVFVGHHFETVQRITLQQRLHIYNAYINITTDFLMVEEGFIRKCLAHMFYDFPTY